MTVYRNVELIADETDRPGFLRIFAKLNGTIVPLAEAKLGHLEQFGRSPVAVAVKAADAAKAAEAAQAAKAAEAAAVAEAAETQAPPPPPPEDE
jgi:hypothetical protein